MLRFCSSACFHSTVFFCSVVFLFCASTAVVQACFRTTASLSLRPFLPPRFFWSAFVFSPHYGYSAHLIPLFDVLSRSIVPRRFNCTAAFFRRFLVLPLLLHLCFVLPPFYCAAFLCLLFSSILPLICTATILFCGCLTLPRLCSAVFSSSVLFFMFSIRRVVGVEKLLNVRLVFILVNDGFGGFRQSRNTLVL